MDGANMCLDRTGMSGSRFLEKTAEHGLGTVRQGRSAANQCILQKKDQQTLQKEMDESTFGPHRRKRIAFLATFGDTKRECLKKGLGRNKIYIFTKNVQTWDKRKTGLDRTGASGSLFLRSYGNQRKAAET